MRDLGIFVDLDETLVHTGSAADLLSRMGRVEAKRYLLPMPPKLRRLVADEAIAVRRNSHRFLAFLRDITPNVFIMTAGLKSYQTEVLRATNLLNLVKTVYGRTDSVPSFRHAVLVDNVCPNDPKLAELGRRTHASVGYICVAPFYGEQDDELINAGQALADYLRGPTA